MRSDNKDLIRRLYGAHQRGEMDTIPANLSDDSAWNVPGEKAGMRAFVLGRERAMPGATGRRYATDFANVWTIRNGRTGEGQVFADTAALAAVPGESTRKL